MQERLYKHLKQRLRDLRLSSGLTQEEMAEKANISYKYYQAIEEGRKKDLRLSTLSKLAEAHHLNLSKLLDLPRAEGPEKPAKVQYRKKASTKQNKTSGVSKGERTLKKASKRSSR